MKQREAWTKKTSRIPRSLLRGVPVVPKDNIDNINVEGMTATGRFAPRAEPYPVWCGSHEKIEGSWCRRRGESECQ